MEYTNFFFIHDVSCDDMIIIKPATTSLQLETLFMLPYCLLRFEQTFLSIREFSYADSIIDINISLILILYIYVAIFN